MRKSATLFLALTLGAYGNTVPASPAPDLVLRQSPELALQEVIALPEVPGLPPGAQPLSLTCADFNEDGVPDLAVGFRSPRGGAIAIYTGRLEAIYPQVLGPGWAQRLAQEQLGAPFSAPEKVWPTLLEPSTLVAGDFDADGHMDLVAAESGRSHLAWHRGGGRHGLARALAVELPGTLSVLTAGEFDIRDGLEDLAAVVERDSGTALLIFQSSTGALQEAPRLVLLDHPVDSLLLDQVDGLGGHDLLAVGGQVLSLVMGRLHHGDPPGDPQQRLRLVELPFPARAAVLGNFWPEQPTQKEVALFSTEGEIFLARTRDMAQRWPNESLLHLGNLDGNGAAAMASARITSERGEGLLLSHAKGLVLTQASSDAFQKAPRPQAPPALDQSSSGWLSRSSSEVGVSLPLPSLISSHTQIVADVHTPPLALLAMRLNPDALDDLVVLLEGSSAPVVLLTAPRATVTVTSTTDVSDGDTSSIPNLLATPGDDGVISLREAITAANSTSGADALHFDIPTDTDLGCDNGTGVCTIQPTGTGLPTITDALTLDGTTQPAFAGTPLIVIDGSLVDANATGLAVNAGSTTIRGLVMHSFGTNSDIVAWWLGGNFIEGNFLGTDPTGTAPLATTNSIHIYAISGNTIGGTTSPARNLIAGNTGPAVALNEGASGNSVHGNYIGTDITGSLILGNSGNDVAAISSPDNTIGGTEAGQGNLISGGQTSDVPSVGLGNPASTGNLVQGNLIGTDITGTQDLGTVSIAVYIVGGASGNTIGGATAAAANVISGADSSGVSISGSSGNAVYGNLIGTQEDGVTPLPNAEHGVQIYSASGANLIGGRDLGEGNVIAFNGESGVDLRGDAGLDNQIAGNSMHSNGSLAINLCADWDDVGLVCNDPTEVLPNDIMDPDAGSNNLQNYPILTTVDRSTGVVVDGTLNSIANASFTLDLYANAGCDASGHGEAAIFLGSGQVSTDGSGDVSFSLDLGTGASLMPGQVVTATATDSNGSTSEVSACLTVPAVADLQIALTDSPDPVTAGEILTYSITVMNQGPDTATAVVATDTLPAEVSWVSGSSQCAHDAGTVTCTLGPLDSGGSSQVSIQVSVEASYQGMVTNSASVVAAEQDPNLADNSDQEITEVRPRLVFQDGFESGDLSGWSPTRTGI